MFFNKDDSKNNFTDAFLFSSILIFEEFSKPSGSEENLFLDCFGKKTVLKQNRNFWDLKENEFLVEVLYVSVDPAMRGWISEVENYLYLDNGLRLWRDFLKK